jgi:hypothetical protein
MFPWASKNKTSANQGDNMALPADQEKGPVPAGYFIIFPGLSADIAY